MSSSGIKLSNLRNYQRVNPDFATITLQVKTMDGEEYFSPSVSSVMILFFVGVSTLLMILSQTSATKSQLHLIAHIDALMLLGSEMKVLHLLIAFVMEALLDFKMFSSMLILPAKL